MGRDGEERLGEMGRRDRESWEEMVRYMGKRWRGEMGRRDLDKR